MQLTFLQVAGDYRKVSAEIGPYPFLRVESQLRFLVYGIRSMTLETAIRKNGANIAIEIDLTS